VRNLKKIFIGVASVATFLLFALPVFASWDEKITGSMDVSSNYPGLTIQLSAWSNTDGTDGGNGEYYYAVNGNKFHLDVQQVCTNVDRVNAIGIVNIQAGFTGVNPENNWGLIGVRDNGETDDQVRAVIGLSKTDAEIQCESSNSFPAIVSVGNFIVRTR
jgi:hypothetical protein